MTVLNYRPLLSKHRHEPAKSFRTFDLGPVSHNQPWEPQGGIARIETCACGAQRRVNVNGEHIEDGPWRDKEFVNSVLSGKCRKTIL
jgi:hypothetical protein